MRLPEAANHSTAICCPPLVKLCMPGSSFPRFAGRRCSPRARPFWLSRPLYEGGKQVCAKECGTSCACQVHGLSPGHARTGDRLLPAAALRHKRPFEQRCWNGRLPSESCHWHGMAGPGGHNVLRYGHISDRVPLVPYSGGTSASRAPFVSHDGVKGPGTDSTESTHQPLLSYQPSNDDEARESR